MAKAVRIKQADGTWQDIALMGPQGPKGDPAGILDVSLILQPRVVGSPRALYPADGWFLYQHASRYSHNISKSDGTNEDFTLDVNKYAWTALKAGTYTITASLGTPSGATVPNAGTLSARICIKNGAVPVAADYLVEDTNAADAAGRSLVCTVTFTQTLAVGDQISLFAKCDGFGSPTPITVGVLYFGMVRNGTGPAGAPGTNGAPGGTMDAVNYRSSNIGTSGPTASVTNGAYVVMDPRVSGQALIEPAGSFIENADKTVTVVNAGWYSISGSVVTLVNYDGAITTKIDVDGVPVANMGARGEAGRGAQANVSTAAVKLIAGAKVSIQAIAGAPSGTVNCALQQFSITRVGGPKGDKGADGVAGAPGAAGNSATVPIEAWHNVGAAGEPAYGSNVVVGSSALQYRKDPAGNVFLRGALGVNAAGTSTAFQLPVGYRPSIYLRGNPLRAGAGTPLMDIGTDGSVTIYNGAAGSIIYFGDFIFASDQAMFPTGPKGDQGQVEPAYMTFADLVTAMPGQNIDVKIGAVASTSTPQPFTLNADGTLTCAVAGHYAITTSVGNSVTLGAGQRLEYTIQASRGGGAYAAIGVGTGYSPWAFVNITGAGSFAVGDKVKLGAYADVIIASQTVRTYSTTIERYGAGPQGAKGDTGGNATVPIDPWHTVGAAGEPAYASGWTATGNIPLRFRKDPLGRVWVQGTANGTSGTTMFTLPVGYRPTADYVYDNLQQSAVAGSYAQVNTAGVVTVTFTVGAGAGYVDFSFDTGTVTAMPTGPQGPKGDTGAAGVARTWRGVDSATIKTATTGWTEVSSLLRITLTPISTRFYTLRLVAQFEHNTINNYAAMWFWDIGSAAQLPGTYFVKRFPVANTNETIVFEQTLRGSDFPAGSRIISPYWATAAGTCSLRSDAAMTTFTITETEAGT